MAGSIQKGVQEGTDPTLHYKPVVVGNTEANPIPVDINPMPFFLQVSLGLITGLSIVSLAGRNPEIDASSEEDIWDHGGTYLFPTSASTLTVSSTNANDTSAGTGARTVTIHGLDSAYASISETVSMNGTSSVTTANSFIRVQSAVVATAGGAATNEGDISVLSGLNPLANILSGYGVTRMAIYTVPAGKTGYVTRQFANIITSNGASGVKDGEATIMVRPFGEIFRKARSVGLITVGNTFPDVRVQTFSPMPEKTDLKVRFTGNQNNVTIISGIDILLKDN